MNRINPSIDIGPFSIYWYGILLTIGFALTVLFSFSEWKNKNYSKYHFISIFWISLIAGVLGARVWYLIFNPKDIHGILSFFSISQGRAIQGSVFFGIFSLFLYIKYFAPDIEWRYAFSILIPNILIGQAIGRWGNFFDQNIYGQIIEDPTSGLFSLLPSYIKEGMYISGDYRQPLFLYESFIDLLGWVLINKIIKNYKVFKPGVHGGIYLLWYGSTRAIMENHRDSEFIMQIGNINTSFIWSMIFMIIGILVIIYYQCFYKQFQFFYLYQRKLIARYIFSFRFVFIDIKKFHKIKDDFKNNLHKQELKRKELYNSIYEWYF